MFVDFDEFGEYDDNFDNEYFDQYLDDYEKDNDIQIRKGGGTLSL